MHPAAGQPSVGDPPPPPPEHRPGHERRGLEFERVVFFSDAVFAIAITLLALDIRVPDLEAPAESLAGTLLGLLPATAAYVLSFLVIGVLWTGHHRLFFHIVDYDYRLMWMNLIFLLSVAFIPVPTQVIAQYGHLPLATMFYAGCLSLVALLEYGVWQYASRRPHLLRAGTTPRLARYIGLRVLAIATVFALSLPLALLSTTAAQLSWALILFAHNALRRRFPEEHRLRA